MTIIPIQHDVYSNLATVYPSLGEYDQAKELTEKELIIWKNIFGLDHAHVATSYNDLRSVYYSQGEYDKAEEFCDKAQVTGKKIYGEDHADVATSYNNLASVYRTVYNSLGEYNQAKAKKYTEKNTNDKERVLRRRSCPRNNQQVMQVNGIKVRR